METMEENKTTPETAPDCQPEEAPMSAKEKLYSKIKLPLWAVDCIIAACLVGIVVCIIFGRS